jgi:hypothetical protein
MSPVGAIQNSSCRSIEDQHDRQNPVLAEAGTK